MERTYTCIHCGKEFTAKKSNARFCSRSCCVLWHRRYTKISEDRDNIIQSCEQIISQIDKENLKKFDDATEEFLSKQSKLIETITQMLESIWLPNKVGSGGIIDLTPLGGNGMIKVEFIKKNK